MYTFSQSKTSCTRLSPMELSWYMTYIVTSIVVTPLKAIAKSNRNLFAVASKSDKERQLERERQKKCNIAIAILENFDNTIII